MRFLHHFQTRKEFKMYDLRILLIWLVLGLLLYLIANKPEREEKENTKTKTAVQKDKRNVERFVIDQLREMDFVDKFDLTAFIPSNQSRGMISVKIMLNLGVAPLRIENEVLVLAMVDPYDLETIDIVREITGREVKPVLITRNELIAVVGDQ